MHDPIDNDLKAYRVAKGLAKSLPSGVEGLQKEQHRLDGIRLLDLHRGGGEGITVHYTGIGTAVEEATGRVDRWIASVGDCARRLRELALYVSNNYPDAYSRLHFVCVDWSPPGDIRRDPFPTEKLVSDLDAITREIGQWLYRPYASVRTAEGLLDLILIHMTDERRFGRAQFYRFRQQGLIHDFYFPGPNREPRTLTLGDILDIVERITMVKNQEPKRRSKSAKVSKRRMSR